MTGNRARPKTADGEDSAKGRRCEKAYERMQSRWLQRQALVHTLAQLAPETLLEGSLT